MKFILPILLLGIGFASGWLISNQRMNEKIKDYFPESMRAMMCPEKTGHGILSHALDYAWKLKCYKAMLMTGRKDEATYRFYESAGFGRHLKQAFIAKPEPVE